MCGIAGLVGLPLGSDPADLATALAGRMRHRGPDHAGHLIDPAGPALLVNTRLAIIDLSPRADQPMCFDGRHHLVFNGEIYNHHRLREDLRQEGIAFQTTSDTEVLLRLLLHRGRAALSLLQGMFAFALWDARDRTLLLARDPFGIKPLHAGFSGSGIAFASELRTLLAALPVRPKLRPQGLGEYLRSGCHNPDEPLLDGVHSLPPGESWLWSGGRIDRQVFSSIPISLLETHATPAHFRSAWIDAVENHMVSDVPVGIFLSGGIDSAAVLAAACLRGCPPSLALTLQLEHVPSEVPDAAALAGRFSIPHTTFSLPSLEIPALFQRHLEVQDSPSMDGFNVFCISHAARLQGLKVILTGLGGDELLGGYPSFQRIPRLHRLFHLLPPRLRPLLAPAPLLHALGASRHGRLLEWISAPPSWSHAYACYRGVFPRNSIARMLASLGLPVPPPTAPPADPAGPEWSDPRTLIAHFEFTQYLRHQLLIDGDACSMAHSVELRHPFLDEVLWRTAAALPLNTRFESRKRLLWRSLPELPASLFNRPKTGFSLPYETWFQGPLRPFLSHIPAPLAPHARTWYQKTALLTLSHWLDRHGLSF